MSTTETAIRDYVDTPAGRVAYRAVGAGPAALFVHGVFLNADMWGDVMTALADRRRCIAVDLLAHGYTDERHDADFSFAGQAAMLLDVIDALDLDQVDLVANDSGGGIAQIFAARHPERVRSMVLTNCDTHDGWPPPEFLPTFEMMTGDGTADMLRALAADPAAVRQAVATGFEHLDRVSDEMLSGFIEPLVRSDERIEALRRFFLAMDCQDTVAVEPLLRQFPAPTLIVWGGDDVFFDRRWAAWLRETLPNVVRVVELPTARLFFPIDRPDDLAHEIAHHWA